MRLRRESLLVLAMLTALCLLAGMVVGIQSGKWATTGPRASPTTPRETPLGAAAPRGFPTATAQVLQPTPSAGQMAVLFVGIDNTSSLQPKLEGCWLVAFSPGINQYYILSFPPEERFRLASFGSDAPLADIYVQDVQQALGYRFTRDAIQSVFPAMAIQATVTVDRADLADLAFKIGGVTIAGDRLAGDTLTAAYDTQSFKGASARMSFQHDVFLALFQALAAQHWTPLSVVDYLEGLPKAVRPEDTAALNQLAANAPALQTSELAWKIVGDDHGAATVP